LLAYVDTDNDLIIFFIMMSEYFENSVNFFLNYYFINYTVFLLRIIKNINFNMSLDHMYCSRCREGFEPNEKIVNSNGELWHPQCFV
jgi:hypothetical protein